MIRRIGINLLEWGRLFSRPSHWTAVRRSIAPLYPSHHADEEHLTAAIDWLCRAQDATSGGVASGYFFRTGWGHPYPETSGYIIPTFLRWASVTGQERFLERALRIGDWEIDIQLPSGAVRGGRGRPTAPASPIVFNTAQVILGWTSLYRTVGYERFLAAAVRAVDWLVRMQDPDGKWSRHVYMGVPHAYHARVAWALLEVHALTPNSLYADAARRSVEWVLAQSRPDGWFARMELVPGRPPPTHTIAYTLRGLLEASRRLGGALGQRGLLAVRRTCEQLLGILPADPLPFVPAAFDAEWRSVDAYTCLTGNAQLAVLWLELHALDGDDRLFQAAVRLLDLVKATQCLDSPNPGIRGGISGSWPIWGRYVPFAYPNWAAKFFADGLLAKRGIPHKVEWRI